MRLTVVSSYVYDLHPYSSVILEARAGAGPQ